MILLALATGARCGELLAPQSPDLDFDNGFSTKSEKPRRFMLPASALDALLEHRAGQDRDKTLFVLGYEDNQLVFCRPEGGYYNPVCIGCRVSRLMKKSGLDGVSLYSLRHVPITAVAKCLGHYAHALEADEIAAAKIWNEWPT